MKGFHYNTLVINVNEYMGSQWALFVPTVVFLYDYKGPPSVQGCSGLLKYSVDCLFQSINHNQN
jgi:hypothetical protein